MKTDWKKVKLGDIATFSNGVNFGKESYASGVKLIGVSNFGNKYFPEYEELEEINEKVLRENDYLKDGDIVFVRSNGNKELVGRCMLIQNPPALVTYSGFCIRARLNDIENYNPRFFTYYFKSKTFRKAMSNSAIGANIQNLNQGLLSNHEISLPSLATQQKIASILSAYDDLIENNRKQIKLLEEAAQRLYKEWFVDLRFPGYENVAIVDGVPEGWRIGTLGDLGNIITGKTPSKKNERYYGSAIPFVKIPDMHDCIYPITTEECLSLEGANSQKNKFIPPESLIVSCIGTAGLVNIAFELCQTNQQINSIICNNNDTLYYLYFFIKSKREYLNALGSNGATMVNVNKEKFGRIEILIPSEFVIEKFKYVVKPYFEKIKSLQQQIQLLQQARDKLLPRLMSGEMEV